MSAWARGLPVNPNLRNSFLDNEVTEGNHVWNYDTRPSPADDPSKYPYFPGGSKQTEPWFFASKTNEQGPPMDPGPGCGFDGAFNRFIAFRGNVVRSNGGIVGAPAPSDAATSPITPLEIASPQCAAPRPTCWLRTRPSR